MFSEYVAPLKRRGQKRQQRETLSFDNTAGHRQNQTTTAVERFSVVTLKLGHGDIDRVPLVRTSRG